MILVIDNYDSFTYNLVQYIGVINTNIMVIKNDQMTVRDIIRLSPEKIIISPGPGIPREAGISVELVSKFYKNCPIFGICLGHQAIVDAFGGDLVRSKNILHGKTSHIQCSLSRIFNDIPRTLTVTRYHSLVANKSNFPNKLRIIAETDSGTIMGMEHRDYPVFGLQFHPE